MTPLAHAGSPLAPHDLWTSWSTDPLVIAGLIAAGWAYARGRRRGPGSARRATMFAGGLGAVAVALLSPLDALSGALASAHMVQHVLLVLVAAPLFAFSASSGPLLRGTPAPIRRAVARARVRLGLTTGRVRTLAHPLAVWFLAVAALWFWHSAAAYEAALRSDLLHALEHLSFFATALLFWVLIGRLAHAGLAGAALLLVFGMAVQSIFLSVLLTFARAPWYPSYAASTRPWGLDPLADQQLAGAIMWVPAGAVYAAAGLLLFMSWMREGDVDLSAEDRRVDRSRVA